MANSPSHKFGQIIGDVLELAIEPFLAEFCQNNNLFLDKRGKRLARQGRNKVSWQDLDGNTHDLDFVIERNGSQNRTGEPVAFIEAAWRRYTKHSRNKAQEIQGAIVPLSAKYQNNSPFLGVILAGEFTEGAFQQLLSLGFTVLFFPYSNVINAFAEVGIDAFYDEDTPDNVFQEKVSKWEDLSQEQKNLLPAILVEQNYVAVKQFMDKLETSIKKKIILVRILPLHGSLLEFETVGKAIEFIDTYNEDDSRAPLYRYEVYIKYINDDHIEGNFHSKNDALEFLKNYLLQ
ncbi:MAG: hypothetical protein JW987_13450 [Anaerolineaceae bacterium]|nr:hypothetical protein [Anaerolineaceae bacterium]